MYLVLLQLTCLLTLIIYSEVQEERGAALRCLLCDFAARSYQGAAAHEVLAEGEPACERSDVLQVSFYLVYSAANSNLRYLGCSRPQTPSATKGFSW